MSLGDDRQPRMASTDEADGVSRLLDDFNIDEGDLDARRFEEHHGFAATEPGSDERALHYFHELQA